jgi:hypothetical protein
MNLAIGLLLIVSGLLLAIPQIYDILLFFEYEKWPVINGSLGLICIIVGITLLIIRNPEKEKKIFTEIK